MNKSKNYENLTIRDKFIFGKVCLKPENRKLILDALLQIDFEEKDGGIEQHIQPLKDAKYARLDLLAEDVSGTVYDAEMQNKSKNKLIQEELPKRSRYYQSLLDTKYLDSGAPYLSLPETYIIFICTFDPFSQNLPVYTFENKCTENAEVRYLDDAHKIFFNTTADLSNLPQNMQNMLKYINEGMVTDEATKTLESEVNKARLKEEWKEEYMITYTIYDEMRAEGLAEGRAEGREVGLAEGREVGLAEGREVGLAEGRAESLDKIKALNAELAEKDKIIESLLEKINQK